MAKQLLSRNILIVATGCAAGAFGKAGLLSPNASSLYCGEKLEGVLNTLGEVAGLDGPLPPVWHMGSCVDNSRVVRLLTALSERLDVDISQLQVAASTPELMSEKSIAIGTYAVAIGVTTHVGITPPVLGGKNVTSVFTDKLNGVVGSSFMVETNPLEASRKIFEHISEKRNGLNLATEMYNPVESNEVQEEVGVGGVVSAKIYYNYA